MIIAGIDPGLSGWVALLNNGEPQAELSYPLKDGYKAWLTMCDCVYIEKPQARPGESRSSSLTIGINYGRIIGWLESGDVNYIEVHAATWKAQMQLRKPRGSGMSKREVKESAVLRAEKLFPDEVFRGPKGGLLDGKAEAYLLAWYADKIERRQ